MSEAETSPVAPHAATATAHGLEVTTAATDPTRADLRVRGEMDLDNADLLPAVVTSHLQRGYRFVQLDLSGLGFIDAAGIGGIVEAHNKCRAVGGTLLLTGLNPQLTRILAITALDESLLSTETWDVPTDTAM